MIATTDKQTRRVRCAIYTRKSHDEGLDQDFNSLDAQREAAESFIASQKHEGWTVLPKHYDDGGYSGGTMDRPALQQLLADIEAGKVDSVTVYKVDRLSRSLLDFAKLIDLFDRNKVAFVSVTQQFNTSTPMGRLVLNILLSFAQFERELCGERIRDKKAASARKGMYIGGGPILGYDIDHENRRLLVNPAEASIVRDIFTRFTQLGSGLLVAKELNQRGCLTKSWTGKSGNVHAGRPWNSLHIYRTITNHKYVGEIAHKGSIYPAEHQPIIERRAWDKVQKMLAENGRVRGSDTRRKTPALLKGLIRCGHCGKAMGITFAQRHGRQYRYYLCGQASRSGYDSCPIRAVAAGVVEAAVIEQLKAVFASPEMIARTYRSAAAKAKTDPALAGEPPTEAEVAESLRDIGPVWNELFPREQERIVKLLVEKVVVFENRIEVLFRSAGLHSLVAEMGQAADDKLQEVAQ